MRPSSPLPLELGSAFTTTEARAAGMSPRQLRRPELLIPFRGVRMTGSSEENEDDADPFRDPLAAAVRVLSHAYALALPEDVHLSHSTAAVHHGIPLPARAFPMAGSPTRPPSERVLVEAAMPAPGRAPRGPRVRGHQSLPRLEPVMRLSGVAVATPAATWASLAGRLSIDELVAVGDAIVRVPRVPGPDGRVLGAPLATFDDLDAVIRAGRRLGVVRLREARTLIRIGSASPRETELRLALTTGTGLPAPALDVDVYSRGAFLGCSEIAYPDFQVAVEYEGDYHRTDRRRWAKDIEKYQAYADAGWRVVQITAEHLRRPGEPARRVRAALRQAGWSPRRR
ncbi:hypothetical protein [Microbacterium capsulatum]|uniref:DUF559 domain-containing protein n=1 Tax=Microbacterium capsulatum TaxID=3041921 RepID=A0ABU0XGJ8_9MICO|nr:hypothetical protein [Microbacterium sp. ASV81]MDQ4214191.1 hypothetical protein [Microbacterium sp. ASV81]